MLNVLFISLLIKEIHCSSKKTADAILSLCIKINNLKDEIVRCERFLQMNDENVIKSHYNRKIQDLDLKNMKNEEQLNSLSINIHLLDPIQAQIRQNQKRDIYQKKMEIISQRSVLIQELNERINTIKKIQTDYKSLTNKYNSLNAELNKLKKI
ncbi:hypothetical protein EDEG_01667 [Edhazardia aedis USNM 41457]|uniref:Uncharacterized protein n=1 Tax=Edhazardia aedis (strain USNM 41457) TaxID=1003232 RepID=J8ZWG5_EDHAE|nr:hypothetical protein EDEG_01667 [Edhazardia aedis USNM 41457]|eukprot:EJW04033.1 hypothetical protein EDEG_01667 [Edhazardia aedis USNM 41457]